MAAAGLAAARHAGHRRALADGVEAQAADDDLGARRALGTAAVTLEGYAGAIRLNPAPGQVVHLERSTTGMELVGMPQLERSDKTGGSEAPPQPAPPSGFGLLKGLF